MIWNKRELTIVKERKLNFRSNRFYIKSIEDVIANRTDEKRYLISEVFYTEKTGVYRYRAIPEGVQIIAFTEDGKKKILLNQVKYYEVKGETYYMLQLEPNIKVRKTALNNIFSTHKAVSPVRTQGGNVTTFLENKYLYRILEKERYIELKEKIAQPNAVFYIGDTFTKTSLEDTVNLIDLQLVDIFLLDDLLREEYFNNNVRALILESAWLGRDNTWRQKISQDSEELVYLMKILKKNNIKVIFFNKEDPVHFDAFKHNVKYADIVLTTSAQTIPEYKKIKNIPVLSLGYFINEKRYNSFAVENTEEKTLFFAGSYYPKYTQRSDFFDDNLAFFGKEFNFKIYDRMKNTLSTENKFPVQYTKYIVGGGLTPDELLKETSEYLYTLNLNSITDSNTMIARRVYEMIALGKIQISNYAKSLERLKQYPIIYSKTNNQKELKDKIAVAGQTYPKDKRFEASLDILSKHSAYALLQQINNYVDLNLEVDLNIKITVDTVEEYEQMVRKILTQDKNKNLQLLVSCKESLYQDILQSDYTKEVANVYRFEDLDKDYVLPGYFTEMEYDVNYDKDYLLNLILLHKITPTDEIDGVAFEKSYKQIISEISDIKPQLYTNYTAYNKNKYQTFVVNSEPKCRKASTEEIIILTGAYPSQNNIYRHGFVHTRAKEYKAKGYDVHIVVPSVQDSFYIFENITVECITQETFQKKIRRRDETANIVVHALSKNIYNFLEDVKELCSITIWIHGAEALSAERRTDFFLGDNAKLEFERYKNNVNELRGLWKQILQEWQARFVFVSQWMKDIFDEDMNIEGYEYDYAIIANPIRTDFYTDHDTDSSKLKFLSIRPFASRKYANDITVEAIMALSEKPYFPELSFTIIGDGAHWNEVLEPLMKANFPNVKLLKKFLVDEQIKQYHEKHNIFFAPTRQDSQGVSMCEAMASGLVIFSSKNTAIPEFVSEDSGVLIENDDVSYYVEMVEQFLENPQLLEEYSKNGQESINNIAGNNLVIEKEINYILKK